MTTLTVRLSLLATVPACLVAALFAGALAGSLGAYALIVAAYVLLLVEGRMASRAR